MLTDNLPEKKIFEWLRLFAAPACEDICEASVLPVSDSARRALEDALMDRLITLSQTALMNEYAEEIRKSDTMATAALGLIPKEDRIKKAEDSYSILIKKGPQALDDKYPLLRPRIEKITEYFIKANKEMLKRISENREAVSSAFFSGENFSFITDFSFGGADTHNSGRATTRVVTDRGVFMYKPHDVRQDEFVAWLSGRFFGDRVRVPRCVCCYDEVNKSRYGFCEFIVNSPASDEEGACRYYKNLGSLAAVTHMLGSSDMHFENILSDGIHPIPVDLETCFSSKLKGTYSMRPAMESMVKDLASSIQANGMFPIRLTETVETSPLISTEPQNVSMPVINEMKASVYGFLAEYYEGFRETYLICLENRDEILEMLSEAPEFEIRVILRPSNYYAQIQQAISDKTHLGSRKAMEKKVDERLRFNPNKTDPKKWQQIRQREEFSILNEDIPYFFTTANSMDVYTPEGLGAKDVFKCSAVQRAMDRLKRFSERELAFELDLQKELLEKARVPKGNDFIKESENSRRISDSVSLATALAKAALTLPGGCRYWYSSQGSIMRRAVPLGYYNGLTGIAFALELFRKYHPGTEFEGIIQETGELSIEQMLDRTQYLEGETELTYPGFNINLENGCAGWIEALMGLYHITEDERYLGAARRGLELIRKYRIPDVKDVSRRNGEAGALEILCSHREELNVEEQLIAEYADHLLACKTADVKGCTLWHPIGKGRPVSGMDCGMAGVGKALHMAGTILGEEKYLQGAADAFEYERNVYNENKGGWQNMFRSTVCPEMYGGFSSGNAGLGFLWLYLEDEEMLEKAITSVLNGKPVYSDCLRDGNLGTCDFLIEAGRRLNRPELIKKAGNLLSEIADRPRHYVDRMYHPVFEPTLFSGEAGLLYVMLRLEKPGQVPCILI